MNNALVKAIKRIIDTFSPEDREKVFDRLCEDLADGPQLYHEANTPEGWKKVLLA